MKTVWIVIIFMEIYRKISQEIVWGFHGENMANPITRQSVYEFYHKISKKWHHSLYCLHTI